MGTIISVINNKGGSTKTTTTINLAHALARLKKNTLVIDNDAQCNSTSILMPKESIRRSLYDIYDPDAKNVSVRESIYPTAHPRLYCLPNIPTQASIIMKLIFNMVQHNNKNALLILRKRVREYVNSNYDFTVIDNPPSLDFPVICSLYASDFVLIPNDTGSRASIEGLIRAAEFIGEIRKSGNPDLKLLKILAAKLDRRTAVSESVHEQVNRHFGKDYVFKTVIPINSDIQKAELMKQTIFEYRSNAPGATAYKNLAKEILELLGIKYEEK